MAEGLDWPWPSGPAGCPREGGGGGGGGLLALLSVGKMEEGSL